MNRMRRKLRILPAIMLTFVAACATVCLKISQIPRKLHPIVVTGQMDDMMEFYESLRKQPPAELIRVYDKVKQNFVQNKSDSNRARLVLLLILPHTSFRDTLQRSTCSTSGRGMQSRQPICKVSEICSTTLLAEQQRLTHSVEELSQKMKDEQKRVETCKTRSMP